MSEEFVVGEHTKKLEKVNQDSTFEENAEKASHTLNNKQLNPDKNISWKSKLQKILLGGAAATVAVGGTVYAANKIESHNDWFGQEVNPNEHSLIVDIQKVEDNKGNLQNPTFRISPSQESQELTPEELIAKGINPNSQEFTIKEVKGAAYPSNLKDGQIKDGDHEYGKWGQIYEDDKPTDVFMSGNFYTPKPVEPTESQ